MSDYQHLLDDADGIEARHSTPDSASDSLARLEYSGGRGSGGIAVAERAAAYLRLYDIAYEIRIERARVEILVDAVAACRVLGLLIPYGCPPKRLVVSLSSPDALKDLRQIAERSHHHRVEIVEVGSSPISDGARLNRSDAGPDDRS